MSQANDSVLVTPGSGATVASHAVASKEHEVLAIADFVGHVAGAHALYAFRISNQVHLAGGGLHWDIFNADASLIVRVRGVLRVPDLATIVTGVRQDWLIYRSNTVGTGGTTITAWPADTGDTLDADITCRAKPTGGAGQTTTNWQFYSHNDEAGLANFFQSGALMVRRHTWQNIMPGPLAYGPGLVLRQNQGLAVTQVTGDAAGNSGWMILFSVE